jgi:hypothetical protein
VLWHAVLLFSVLCVFLLEKRPIFIPVLLLPYHHHHHHCCCCCCYDINNNIQEHSCLFFTVHWPSLSSLLTSSDHSFHLCCWIELSHGLPFLCGLVAKSAECLVNLNSSVQSVKAHIMMSLGSSQLLHWVSVSLCKAMVSQPS